MTPQPVTDTRRARTMTTVRARPDKPGGHTASLIRMLAPAQNNPYPSHQETHPVI
jgi:hypothetical protein